MEFVLDVKTFGTGPNAPVVSVGCMALTLDSVRGIVPHGTFYATYDVDAQIKAGAAIDYKAVVFWLKQNDNARSAMCSAPAHDSIMEGLYQFECWMKSMESEVMARVMWGDGEDNAALRSMYERFGRVAPWESLNDRCFRTLRALFPSVPMLMATSQVSSRPLIPVQVRAETLGQIYKQRNQRTVEFG